MSPLTACAVMLQSTGAICYANFVIRLILPLELQRHFQMKLSGSSTSTTLALSSPTQPRSEEHPSELQTLMRNSYAVFCLTTKKNMYTSTTTYTITRQPQYITCA